MSAEVADLLDRAAQRLRTKGWCQGRLGSPGGPCCAYGAILFEVGTVGSTGRPSLSPVGIAALRALEALLTCSVGPWNDRRGRTVGLVLDVFARAAAAERAAAEGTGDPSDGTP